MTVLNPPGWLENAGATHTAAQMRSYLGAILGGYRSTEADLQPRGGVNPFLGEGLWTQQTGTPSMAVQVLSGAAWIPGTESGTQGAYGVLNDGTVTLSVTAAHATLNRIDIVQFRVRDSFYSGANNDALLDVKAGTPASSPAAPSADANAIVLAEVLVGAAVSTIVNANITDRRNMLVTTGGIIPVTGSGVVNPGYQGRYRHRLDGNVLEYDDGSAWQKMADPTIFTAWSTFTPTWAATGTSPALGNGTLIGRYKKIGRTAHVMMRLVFGSTTTSGSGAWSFGGFPAALDRNNSDMIMSALGIGDVSLLPYVGIAQLSVSGGTSIQRIGMSTSAGSLGSIGGAHPFTWDSGDVLTVSGTFETSS